MDVYIASLLRVSAAVFYRVLPGFQPLALALLLTASYGFYAVLQESTPAPPSWRWFRRSAGGRFVAWERQEARGRGGHAGFVHRSWPSERLFFTKYLPISTAPTLRFLRAMISITCRTTPFKLILVPDRCVSGMSRSRRGIWVTCPLMAYFPSSFRVR